MEAGSFTAPGGRDVLKRSSGARLPDFILRWGVTFLSVAILLLIAYFFLKLIDESTTVFDRFGVFGFTFDNRLSGKLQPLAQLLPLILRLPLPRPNDEGSHPDHHARQQDQNDPSPFHIANL